MTINKFSIGILVVLILVVGFTLIESRIVVDEPNNKFLFEPNASVVEGTLIAKMYYGAPGYGENPEEDEQEIVYILQLNKPINVNVTKGDDINSNAFNISEIQLVLSEEIAKPIELHKDKPLQVKGYFFSKQTGHHHTEVLLHVDKILN